MTTIKTIAAALALTAGLVAPAAHAQGAPQGITKTNASVSYADLNLASAEGRAILDRRIESAVERVCGPTTRNIFMDKAVKKCQRQTMAAATQSRELAVSNYNSNRLAKASTKVIRLVAN